MLHSFSLYSDGIFYSIIRIIQIEGFGSIFLFTLLLFKKYVNLVTIVICCLVQLFPIAMLMAKYMKVRVSKLFPKVFEYISLKGSHSKVVQVLVGDPVTMCIWTAIIELNELNK